MQSGLNLIQQTTHSYRELIDLLGGDFYVNKNQFAEVGSTTEYSIDNDLNNPNQEVQVGDKYYYNYLNHFFKAWAWAQLAFTYNKVDFFLAGNIGKNTFDREGLFRSGLFPKGNESFGQSAKQDFTLFGVKGGVTYKINGRNFLFVNGLMQTDPPTVDNTFISPRSRNNTIANPSVSRTTSIEGGYLHRAPKMNLRLVGFSTDVKNLTDIKRFYNETFGNTFINYVLTDMNVRYNGIEAAAEYKVHSTLTVTGVLALNQSYYTNNPKVDIYRDNFVDSTGSGGYTTSQQVYIKNYNLAAGPQTAATLGLNYRSPKYWYANLNANYFDRNYVDINPSRRTAEAVELIQPGSVKYNEILNQEKLPSAFTLDLFAGKSFLLSKTFKNLPRNTFLYINVGVNNLLNNKNISTGGFEQLRFDDQGITEKFPAKYFYAFGTNYFINLSLKF